MKRHNTDFLTNVISEFDNYCHIIKLRQLKLAIVSSSLANRVEAR